MNFLSEYSVCAQCPRKCGVNRFSQTGFCKESNELKVAFAGLHFGEEPPVTVFGGSGTIFFTGCTLRCAFCQNYQISQNGIGKEISSEIFTSMCLLLQENGAENINLVTGSHHIPLIANFIRDAKSNGVEIPFCWNSSAYETVESLELLKDLVTIWLPDFKTLSKSLSKNLFDAENYPEVAKKSVKWMIENFPLKTKKVKSKNSQNHKNSESREKILQGVIVRHLFIPGRFEETAEVLSWLKENADKKSYISLMSQYTPVPFSESEEKLLQRKKSLSCIENRLVNQSENEDLIDLIDIFDFENLFYQELSDDTSWLPDFTKKQPFPSPLAKPLWHWKYGFLK